MKPPIPVPHGDVEPNKLETIRERPKPDITSYISHGLAGLALGQAVYLLFIPLVKFASLQESSRSFDVTLLGQPVLSVLSWGLAILALFFLLGLVTARTSPKGLLRFQEFLWLLLCINLVLGLVVLSLKSTVITKHSIPLRGVMG